MIRERVWIDAPPLPPPVRGCPCRPQATLFVNVASKCGYTEANYRGLQGIYDRYHDHGKLELHSISATLLDTCRSAPGSSGRPASRHPSLILAAEGGADARAGLEVLAFPCNQVGLVCLAPVGQVQLRGGEHAVKVVGGIGPDCARSG